ncbi:hypothetical protein M3Y99_01186800 [Aphelenchoides fujianensis]|nr:hypothetical protein M3Y99_01186800 [Aphelenchoides fujianensis]
MVDSGFLKLLRDRELGLREGGMRPLDLLARHREQSLYQRDLKHHTGCVNALEFSHNEDFLLSAGDDGDVVLWTTHAMMNEERPRPLKTMDSVHLSNIFTLGFSLDDRVGYSAGNDQRFRAHDLTSGQCTYTFTTKRSIHRLDPHPLHESIVAVASEDQELYIADIRAKDYSSYPLGHAVYSVKYNPLHPELVVVALNRAGIAVYDTRNMAEPFAQMKSCKTAEGNRCTHAVWNPSGTGVAAVLTRGDLAFYRCLDNSYTILTDPQYCNQITMKSCTFIDDDAILCGSDRWDIFAWKIPADPEVAKVTDAYAILKGHRSICNHIRYSPRNNLIASSGVEKIVKVWSPFEMQGSVRDPPRRQSSLHHPHPFVHDYDAADSQDEDLTTLFQFDYYVENAMQEGNLLADDSDEDASDDSDLNFGAASIHFQWGSPYDEQSSASSGDDLPSDSELPPLIVEADEEAEGGDSDESEE